MSGPQIGDPVAIQMTIIRRSDMKPLDFGTGDEPLDVRSIWVPCEIASLKPLAVELADGRVIPIACHMPLRRRRLPD